MQFRLGVLELVDSQYSIEKLLPLDIEQIKFGTKGYYITCYKGMVVDSKITVGLEAY